jgi:hypothetical protein
VSEPPRSLLGRRWQVVTGLLLLLTLQAPAVAAETTPPADTVILLQPTTASSALRRSLARIRDELSADRFRVVLADSSTSSAMEAVSENTARDADGATTLAVFGDPQAGEAELCIVRRAARRIAVRRATVVVDDPELMPEALAARALELLRATALELSIESRRAPPPQKPPEPRPEVEMTPTSATSPFAAAAAAAAREARIVAASMGIGIWSSVEGPPAAVVPMGRIGVRLSGWIWARVSVAGLGSRPRVNTAHGSATISQSLGLAELAAVFRPERRLHPMLSLGAGALNVAISGTGAAPLEGRDPHRWSAAFDGGVGVGFGVSSRAALVAELHALVAEPHPVLRFVDIRAATVAYPSVMLTLALEVAP